MTLLFMLLISILNVLSQSWIEQQKIVPESAYKDYVNYYYGHSVDIDNEYAIVGAIGYNSNMGIAYILQLNGSDWDTVATLTASDGVYADEFGHSVAISGDVAVVGARYDDDLGQSSGAVYVFVKPQNGWSDTTETSKLLPDDGNVADYFGYSVDIYGDVIIAGAWFDDDNGNNSGSAYIFEKPSTGWKDTTQTAKLTASDGEVDDRFGVSVGITDSFAIVGAHYDDDNGSQSGSAYIFERPSTGWEDMTQTAKLTASAGAENDQFGASVSISNKVAVVSAQYNDADESDAGSAYVFEEPLSGWTDMTETVRLHPASPSTNYYFGRSVDIYNNWITVGGNSAYAFKKPETGWSAITGETVRFTQSDAFPGDQFGYNVSICDTAALISAARVDDIDQEAGAVYFYNIPVDEWESTETTNETSKKYPYHNILANNSEYYSTSMDYHGDYAIIGAPGYKFNTGRAYILKNNFGHLDTVAVLTASNGSISHYFGYSVAISDSIAVIGAYRAPGASSYDGAVYVYEKKGGEWQSATEDTIVFASANQNQDYFGHDVDFDNNTLVVSAIRDDDNGNNSGSVYIFEYVSGVWDEKAQLNPSDGMENDYFGFSVGIHNDVVIAGAYNNNGGSAYIFEKPAGGWVNGDETAKLTGSNIQENDDFGKSVSIYDSIAVVGAPNYDRNGSNTGMAYLFTKPAGGWIDATETDTLYSSDPDPGERLGSSVHINQNIIVAGATFRENSSSMVTGAAYVYSKPLTGWESMTEDSILMASDGTENDYFGAAVVVYKNKLLVGAYGNDEKGNRAGAAYFYTPPLPQITQQPSDLVNICNQNPVEFTLTAIDADSYQWQSSPDDGSAFENIEDGTDYIGVNNDTLTIYHPKADTNKVFRCLVINSAGALKSDTVGIIITNLPPIPDGDTLAPVLGNTCAAITKTPTAISCNEQITGTTSSPLSYTGQGEYTITWNYEDSYGNTFSQNQKIILHDSVVNSLYEEKQEITASNAFKNGTFGRSIDIDGNYMIVGSYNLQNEGNGYAYIFEKQGSDWEEIAVIEKPGCNTFGYSVCIHDSFAFVSDPYALIGTDEAGKVYVLKNSGGTWMMTDSIKSNQPENRELFGHSIACSDKHLLIGAIQNDDLATDAGCVYLYNFYNGQLSYKKTLYLPEPKTDAEYGSAISIDGDYAVIGARGYNIGASQFKGTEPTGHGIAVVCKSTGYEMEEVAFLRASDRDMGSKFGNAVAIEGDWIAVGACSQNDSGAVYLYKKPDAGWQDTIETQKLANKHRSALGYALDMQNSQLVVGDIYNSEYSTNNGKAFVYQLNNDKWDIYSSFTPVELSHSDFFAGSVAFDGENILAGAKGDDDAGTYTGSLYRFGPTSPCLTGQPLVYTDLCGEDTVILSVAGDNLDSIQWQYAPGEGEPFINIPENDTFTGANNDTLQVITTPDYRHYYYRCKIMNGLSVLFSDTVQVGLESVSPTFICHIDTSVNADDASNEYTISGTLFDPSDVNDNCDIDTIYNDVNYRETLDETTFGLGTHTITWHIIDVSGNHDSCSFDLTVNDVVSIESLTENGIRIYPNPFDNQIIISSDADADFYVELISINGKILEKSRLLSNGKVELSDEYKQGLYILRIYNSESNYAVKMIKE